MKRTKKIQRHQRAMEAVAQVSKQVIMQESKQAMIQVSKLVRSDKDNSQVLAWISDKLLLDFKVKVNMIHLLASQASHCL